MPLRVSESEKFEGETSLYNRIKEMFRVDLRSLAAFRIFLGLLLLIDLLIRAGDAAAFYSDDGIVSRATIAADPERSTWCLSFHMLNGAPLFQQLLFLITGIAAICFSLGYRSRLSTIILLLLYCSMHHRNPLLQQACDSVIRVMLFWVLFLPVGVRWSLDAWRRNRNPQLPLPLEIKSHSSGSILSMASAAILLQVFFVYFFTALLKTDPVWWKEGTAVFYALSLDRLTTPFGHWLLEQSSLHKPMTLATYYFELIAPFLVFIPWKNHLLRTLMAFVFIGFHLVALNPAFALGIFSWVCSTTWLLFLPSTFWDRWLPAGIKRIARWIRINTAQPLTKIFVQVNLSGKIRKMPATGMSARFAQTCVVGFFLGYTLLWNIRTTNPEKFTPYFPEKLNWIGELSGLYQKWSMFAAAPPRVDSWEVIAGKLPDGSEIDLLTGKPVSWKKPGLVSATYKNPKWRKYMGNLTKPKNEAYREEYLTWLTGKWNQSHQPGQQVSDIKYFLVEERAIQDIAPPWSIRQIWPPEEATGRLATR